MAAKKLTAKTNIAAEVAEPLYSLEKLSAELGDPSPGTSALFLGRSTDEEFLALGTEFSTADILEAAPRFLGTALAAMQIKDASGAVHTRGVMGVSVGVVALATQQALVLRDTYRSFLDKGFVSAAAKRDKIREANSDCRVTRDQVIGALHTALPRQGALRDRFDTLSSGAPTPEALAVSMEGLGKLTLALLDGASEEERETLAELGIRAGLEAELKSKAKLLRAVSDVATSGEPAKAVDQRALDLQDGRVLHLIQVIHRAFRDAHAKDASLLQPPLGRMRRLVQRTKVAAVAAPA